MIPGDAVMWRQRRGCMKTLHRPAVLLAIRGRRALILVEEYGRFIERSVDRMSVTERNRGTTYDVDREHDRRAGK